MHHPRILTCVLNYKWNWNDYIFSTGACRYQFPKQARLRITSEEWANVDTYPVAIDARSLTMKTANTFYVNPMSRLLEFPRTTKSVANGPVGKAVILPLAKSVNREQWQLLQWRWWRYTDAFEIYSDNKYVVMRMRL